MYFTILVIVLSLAQTPHVSALSMKVGPLVTGLSPKEGVPGTLITIRGENFGHNSNDLIGMLINRDCVNTQSTEHFPLPLYCSLTHKV